MKNTKNTKTDSEQEDIAITLVGILDRRNPAKTGEEALERLLKTISFDCGCMSAECVEIRYRSIATEAGTNPDEVWRLVSSLHPSLSSENRPSQIAQDVLLMFGTVDLETYESTF